MYFTYVFPDDEQKAWHEDIFSDIYGFIVENEIMVMIIGSTVIAVLVGITICCVLRRRNKRKSTKLQGNSISLETWKYSFLTIILDLFIRT